MWMKKTSKGQTKRNTDQTHIKKIETNYERRTWKPENSRHILSNFNCNKLEATQSSLKLPFISLILKMTIFRSRLKLCPAHRLLIYSQRVIHFKIAIQLFPFFVSILLFAIQRVPVIAFLRKSQCKASAQCLCESTRDTFVVLPEFCLIWPVCI